MDTYSIPQLMRLICSGRLYDTFADAANTNALNVVLHGPDNPGAPAGQVAAAVAG